MSKEIYIGDGVYARFDGYQVWLRTRRDGGDHEIALEPTVYQSLVEYADQVFQRVELPR